MRRRHVRFHDLALAAALLALVLIPGAARALDDPWPGIRKDLFQDRPLAEEDGSVTLEAPVRAEDAALVPLTVRMPGATANSIKALTLVVDKNPSPVVAAFAFGPGAGEGARMLATRVRIDMYSNVRAIVETADGRLHMASRFVKAAGGCSAPALKDADSALAGIGQMRVKRFDTASASGALPEAQVMIRHPNYSGMQMNQLTGLYIPAQFVEEIEVRRGSDLVFRMTGGISLSEDPNIRFTHASGSGPIAVTAKDTGERVFTAHSRERTVRLDWRVSPLSAGALRMPRRGGDEGRTTGRLRLLR